MVPSPWRDTPASLRSMRCLWTVFLTLLVTSSVFATELTGSVVSVLDDDTIEVLNGHHADRIRQNIGDPCGGQRPGGCLPLTHPGSRISNERTGGVDSELDYRSNMASRVPIAAMLLRTRMASKSDRNSLIKCSHLLYRNCTADSAFRQTWMSSRAGAGGIGNMRREIRCWKG